VIQGAVHAVDDLVAQDRLPLRRADLGEELAGEEREQQVAHLRHARGELFGDLVREEFHLQARLQVALAVLVGEVGDEGIERQEGADLRLVLLVHLLLGFRLVGAVRDEAEEPGRSATTTEQYDDRDDDEELALPPLRRRLARMRAVLRHTPLPARAWRAAPGTATDMPRAF